MSFKSFPTVKTSERIDKSAADDAMLKVAVKYGSAPDETWRLAYAQGVCGARWGAREYMVNLVSCERFALTAEEPRKA